MHETICQKYKAIICFIVFAAVSCGCLAGELEDAIAKMSDSANAADITNGSEGNITSRAAGIKPDMSNLDQQLAQIEANYKEQIDAATLAQNHDPLNSELSTHNASNKSATVNDIKQITDKNSSARKKIKITKNDELLVAAQNIDKATIDEANGMVTMPTVVRTQASIEDRIVTCHEAGDEIPRKCYKTLIIKATQPDDIKFTTELYFSAQSYAGHRTYADLKTGKIRYDGANSVHSSSRVENAFDIISPNAQIISIRHLGGGWWSGHTHEVYSNQTQPSAANEYVYSSDIAQGGMGSKKNRRRNGDKYRGRVERWEVVARPAPVLVESWDDGGCAQLASYAQDSFCEGPVINLIDVNVTRTIAGYPTPVTRPHWQEEHIYSCGGGSWAHECESLHAAGCAQIDSKCIESRGPFCVEYLQTFNCGNKHITSNLNLDGAKMAIGADAKECANDGFDVEDFGNAVAQLSMVDEMQKNIVRDGEGSVLLFKGDRLTCDKDWGSDIKNCCNLKGIFKNIIGHKCPKEVEEILAPAVIRQKRCVEVAGWQCIAKTLGKCRKWRKSFCCYQSRLARIFQQIARQQLGLGWGSAESPSCGPLDPHSFGRLNFDEPFARNLLKELVDEANINAQKYANTANAKLANSADLNEKVKRLQDRIGSYYDSKINNAEHKQ